MTDPRPRGERLRFAVVAIAYLATSLFVLRDVVPDPYRLLPYNSTIDPASRQIGHFDQSMVVSTITRNANVLVTEPWNLLGDGQCYPFPKSFTLGEHMFGEGLQMAVPWVLTGDPILAYNLMLVLTLWLPGITMYLLAHHFTRHVGAAFVAGLILQLSPIRIIDGGHPYLHAEFWLPLILLCLHKLFATDRRWTAAVGIGLFLALEGLETIYVLLACAMVSSVYGLHLVFRYRERALRALLPLAAALAFALGLTWLALGPYFETRATWDVLAGRPTVLFPLSSYGPGTPYFIGFIAAALVVLGLGDRFRGPREVNGDDPRIAFAIAAVVILWATVASIPIPGTNLQIPGLFVLVWEWVPGLDALRGLFAVNVGLTVPIAFLAGYGVLVLSERLPGETAAVGLVVVLSILIVSERFAPPFARAAFGSPLSLAAWDARPPEDDIDLIRTASIGPVADVPMSPPSNEFARMALSRHLLLQAWHPVPSSSCYNSFDTPLASHVFQLSDLLPDAGAAEALAAVGFEAVLSHTNAWWPPHWRRWQARIEQNPQVESVMPELARSSGLTAYRLEPRSEVHHDLTRLSGRAQGPAVELEREAGGEKRLVVPFVFRNPGPGTYVLPPPMAPRDGVLTWTLGGARVADPEDVRVLWPIALGAGNIMRIDVKATTALPPGVYDVGLSAKKAPDDVLATRSVIVPPIEEPGAE